MLSEFGEVCLHIQPHRDVLISLPLKSHKASFVPCNSLLWRDFISRNSIEPFLSICNRNLFLPFFPLFVGFGIFFFPFHVNCFKRLLRLDGSLYQQAMFSQGERRISSFSALFCTLLALSNPGVPHQHPENVSEVFVCMHWQVKNGVTNWNVSGTEVGLFSSSTGNPAFRDKNKVLGTLNTLTRVLQNVKNYIRATFSKV